MNARRTGAALAPVVLVALAFACGPTDPAGPLVQVDREGFFVSPDPVAGQWFGGDGVTLLVPRDRDTALVGRLDPRAGPVTVLAGDGFAPHALRTERSGRPLGSAVRAALGDAFADDDGELPLLLAGALRDIPSRARPAPETALELRPAGAPPAAGAPLAAWAPRDAPFVWVRSVEAGYRFAGLLDELCGRVLAARGDARDAATLRLVLHDLLLPTIWRANPSGEKGVSECGVVVLPPLVRGRLRAAVLFRVVDPELHDMETRAGIALELRPDHLWRPAADPFPQRRARRNTRRRVADVEIVATDEFLADALARGCADTHAADPATRAFLGGVGTGPGRRALAAVFPAGTEVWADAALRTDLLAGAAVLLRSHWPDAEPRRGAAGTRPLDLLRAEVRTDVKGAFVRLATRHPVTARAWADALAGPGAPTRLAAACDANRGDLAALAVLDGVFPDPVERSLVVLGRRPVCPSGGAYRVHPITRAVTCGAHGPPAPPAPPSEAAPWPVTEVTTEGADVTFRVAIDWRRKE